MPFTFENLSLPGVIEITPRVFPDSRGYFLETYKRSEFVENGIMEEFVQENYSYSAKGVLRGLHYQIDPSAQGKLVQCVLGEIYDVAVDIRKNSPTYLQWVSTILSDENRKVLYIPVGFAHGFHVHSDFAHVVYKVTSEYDPARERGIIWNDPEIGIDWNSNEVRLSEKDAKLPLLQEAETF